LPKFIRRLQRIGSSILVSLPKEWVDANKLEKSSEIEIETSQNSLSITANKDSRPSKEVVISYPLPKDELKERRQFQLKIEKKFVNQ
jgi:antitoxin component of MazEF toxin-antitoxin module